MNHYIYAAMLPTGEIKIGCANNVKARMSSLHATLIGFIEGDFAFERMMHNRFRPYWIRREQFIPCGEIYQFFGNRAAYRPDPAYADRLLMASFRSAYGKALCRSLLYRDLLPQGLSYFGRKPWWNAFHPPAISIWKRWQHPDNGRWYADIDHSLERGHDWCGVAGFANEQAEKRSSAARYVRFKARRKLRDNFKEPWLRAMDDADVTRRYLARQARLLRHLAGGTG